MFAHENIPKEKKKILNETWKSWRLTGKAFGNFLENYKYEGNVSKDPNDYSLNYMPMEYFMITKQKIIDFVISDPSISAEAMAYKIGISSRAVEKQIAKLRSMGILSREGADFGGYWRIVINPQTEQ